MYVIMGATGNVGGAAARVLLEAGEPVIAVVRSEEKGATLKRAGAELAVADVDDVDSLRAAFRRGRRAFLLNPPADVSGDSDAEETRTARAIADALDGSGLEKVVVESTYAAQEGEAIGDSSVLYALERQVEATGIPAAINRAGYYYSNFAMLLEPAKGGTLPTMFPADMPLAMVAPEDLGRSAARRLRSELDDVGVRFVGGPAWRSFADAAAAFAAALGREVTVQEVPPESWHDAYRQLGFSDASADAYGRMTRAAIDKRDDFPEPDECGTITLERYIADLVAAQRTA